MRFPPRIRSVQVLIGVALLSVLGWTDPATAQLPVTGTLGQGTPAWSGSGWPVVPAQSVATMTMTQTSASNALQTLMLLGAPNQRVAIRGIVCYLSVAGTSTITVSDGGTVILDLGSFTNLAPGAWSFGLATGVWGRLGNTMTVNVGAGGSGVTSTCSVIADRS